MKLQNTFVQSKLNQDIDERLLPKGQYPDALNIRVANSEGSDVGAIENVKGNEQLTSLGLTNADTIGAFADGSSQKIYWFITSDTKDLVVEYDVPNAQTNILLESSNPNGVLAFNKNYLVTGVVKIVNGDSDRDLLIWTDDLNPPRVVNIERAKGYTADGFSELDIALIKRPPRSAPSCTLTYSPITTENNLENKFLTFAYRYKYLDGGYSAISSFSNYQFSPSDFELDYQTMENNGMANAFNAVKIDFNTGDERVTDIQLVYKESNSNTLYIIESFNKTNEVWGNDETQSFTFTNSKVLAALPEDELFRTYDNVPRKAKALELIGSRIAFGNYVEQYDLKNIYGEDINVDFSLSLTQLDLNGENLGVTIGNSVITNDLITIDFTGITLAAGNRLTFTFDLGNAAYDGLYGDTFDFILNQNFVDATSLASNADFIYFIETLISAAFEAGYTITPPTGGVVTSAVNGFTITGSTATSISILAPNIVYTVDAVDETASFQWDTSTQVFYREVAVASSLKTNRSYEVGIIYMDADGRKTFVQTDEDNTIYVDQEFSTFQNKIVTNINHLAPEWADRYKLVVKQNKGAYQTIYTNLFYEDGLFRWIKLEGANIGKVVQGDTLIVKSDLGGALADVTKLRVLEIKEQQSDFLGDVADPDNIIEEEGLYMRVKPVGIDMSFDESTIRTYEAGSHLRYTGRTRTSPIFGDDSTGAFVPYPLNAGSRVRIYVQFKARGSISYTAEYDKSFKVSGSYASVQSWFETEVIDLGSFGRDFTRGVTTGSFPNFLVGDGEYGYGYGFCDSNGVPVANGSDLGEKFFAWSHRDGTASRKITTTIKIEILASDGTIILETEPEDKGTELYYETSQTFDVIGGYHQGNLLNQSAVNPSAIVEMDFFNCYVMGNGAESYRFKDARYVGSDSDGQQLLANYLNIDLRPSTTSTEKYREVRRFSDITYSEPYNENSNVNGIGVFNLSKANYKEDLDKKYGTIQKLFFRDTNLLVLQEDKVGYVLFGKDILYNADGSSNVSSVEDVLGDFRAYTGEYGISRNPESFAFDANNVYFMDSKRGCVCRLGADGITEISMAGMRQFFKDDFKNAIDQKKLGSYDPYLDQYVAHSSVDLLLKPFSIDCSDVFYRGDTSGVYEITIDYGILVGNAGFSYVTNGVPVNFTLEYDGVVTDYGYFGDPSYDSVLIGLGLPATTDVGTGSIVFSKNKNIPRDAVLTVTAPIVGTNFQISGNCVVENELTVINVILNNPEDEGTSIKSRYKWSTDTYSSPFTTYDTVFDVDEVELFNTVVGNEGSIKVPITGSSVRVESYQGVAQNLVWNGEENKIGYLISNTLYTDADIEALEAAATFPAFTEVTNGDDVTRYIEFDYDRLSNEQYLYIIWDYRDVVLGINANTKINIYFDSSGSMNSTIAPLETMRDTLLRDALLPLYGGDVAAYDANVTVISQANERTIDMMNINGTTPTGNVISLIFQDEANPVYQGVSFADTDALTAQYITDIADFRARLAGFAANYLRVVVFQVDESGGAFDFQNFIKAVELGTGNYAGASGLSDRTEIAYKYNITDGGTANYYLTQILLALTELGYEL